MCHPVYLVSAFLVLACGGKTGDSAPAIMSVLVSGPTTVDSLATVTLTAEVHGSGQFSPIVDWVINSGGGSLSAFSGASVQYTAPGAHVSAIAEIIAKSDADSSRVGRISLHINPLPPSENAAAGLYDGVLHEVQTRPSGAPAGTTDIATSYTLSVAGPGAVVVSGYFGGGPNFCPDGIPAALQDDQTITFGRFLCPSIPLSFPLGCTMQLIIAGGTGTWSYGGVVQFSVNSMLESCAGNVLASDSVSATRRP